MFKKLLDNHRLLMLAGCLLPIIIVGIFLIFGFTGRTLSFLLILLCPLSHIFLMKGHGKDKGHH